MDGSNPDRDAISSHREREEHLRERLHDQVAGLRTWPAFLLIAAMIALRSLLTFVDSPGLTVRLLAFAGPAFVSIFLLLWWVFLSRAPVHSRLVGTLGFLAIAVLGCLTLHPSMRGIMIAILIVPLCTLAFVLPILSLANGGSRRVAFSLTSSALAMLAFNLIQSDGFDGRLNGKFAWRWQSTAEDRFLESLSTRTLSPSTDAVSYVESTTSQWPGFRGSKRDGKVIGVTINPDWESNPPKELWRTPIGPGWSSFSVLGSRIFSHEQRGENEAVLCLDANSGKLIWEYSYPGRFWEAVGGAGPRATPTIHQNSIVSLGAQGALKRLDASTGKVIWERDLKVDASRVPMTWGFSSSPLVVDSLVVVFAGGSDGKGILAYHFENGELAWSCESGVHTYSSAQDSIIAGQRGILMLSDLGLQFLSIEDGSEFWRFTWKQEDYRVVQPLVFHDSILVGGSLGIGAKRITVTREENTWKINEDWKTNSLKPDFNDTVYHQGFFYGFDSGIFCCIDSKTGKRAWKKGRYGNGQVLLLEDSGQLLVTSEQGEVILIQASPEKLIELAKLHPFTGKTWNHPVLVGNKLFVRNAEECACFELPTSQK
ncbi:PQQ-binding-like beta-propeller repeat protein [Pirellulaceae bacterium SH501]